MDLEDAALGIAHLCVRNTIIEKFHSDGKLTDEEMKAFNKKVSNKLFTALTSLTSRNPEECEAAFALFANHRPENWDSPRMDQGIQKAVARFKRERKD